MINMTTVQDTMLNQELASVEFSKIGALQQKRTIAFVNHFIMTTVQFLNSFMKKCEHQLMEFERKLEKVEAAMVLLEDRLSSIPEVNTPLQPESVITSTDQIDDNLQEQNTQIIELNTEENSDLKQKSSLAEHPEYERFVKMLQVGVPLQAVKLKVSLEGLDPNILDKIINKL